jgi:sorbitol-specific phosphotransferase system component IIBC
MRKLLAMLVLTPFLLGGTGAAMAQSGHVMLGSDEIKWGAAPPSLPRGAMVAVIEGKPSEPGPSST